MSLISPALADGFLFCFFFLSLGPLGSLSLVKNYFMGFFFFDSSHLNGCEVISHCVFYLHFPTD